MSDKITMNDKSLVEFLKEVKNNKVEGLMLVYFNESDNNESDNNEIKKTFNTTHTVAGSFDVMTFHIIIEAFLKTQLANMKRHVLNIKQKHNVEDESLEDYFAEVREQLHEVVDTLTLNEEED